MLASTAPALTVSLPANLALAATRLPRWNKLSLSPNLALPCWLAGAGLAALLAALHGWDD